MDGEFEMNLGITMFQTDVSARPAPLAQAIEERGFSSYFVPEHTHIPSSRSTPAPTGEEELDDSYRRTLDPMVALSAAATVTNRISLGTGVALVAQHDPIALAKQIATLDLLSGGRFVLGIGFGWNAEEMADHNVEFSRRRDVVREYMAVMNQLWSNQEATFAGEFVTLQPSWAWPKPAQQPRPKTLLGGGGGPKLFSHIAEYADGWMPIGGAGIRQALPELRQAFESAGRDPDHIEIVPFGTIPDKPKLDYYEELGVTEVVLRVPSGPMTAVLKVLDAYTAFLD